MSIKLADTLGPMGNFPAAKSSDVEITLLDKTKKSIQKAYEDGDFGNSKVLCKFINDNTNLVWDAKTWNGFNFNNTNASFIWKDGDIVYCSCYNYATSVTEHYVLNKKTSTWETKIWNTTYDYITGNQIWDDGNNIYYSNAIIQYALNKETSTWEAKTWNGEFTRPSKNCIWKDSDKVYYSDGDLQFVLNKETSTWETKTWNGFNPQGQYIWKDGNNVYLSHKGEEWDFSDPENPIQITINYQYVLDRETDTWIEKDWNGFEPEDSFMIWSDGFNTYYSQSDIYQKVLNRKTDTWEDKTWASNVTLQFLTGENVWNDGENVYHSLNGTYNYALIRTMNNTINSFINY